MSSTEEKNPAAPENTHYDVVIAGGGMVGISLACVLVAASDRAFAQEPAKQFSVLVVDRAPLQASGPPAYHPSFDARATALSLSSLEIYRAAGVEDAIRQHAEAIRSVHVSDKGHSGSNRMAASDEGLDIFGCVVENQWLGSSLLAAGASATGVELCGRAAVSRVVPQRNGVTCVVEKAGGDSDDASAVTISADLLVIADGAESSLRKSLGIEAERDDYRQTAVIANVQTTQPHKGAAFERFTEEGAIAFLPLPDLADARHRSAVVWTLPNDRADALLACQADKQSERIRETMQQEFGFRLGEINRVGEVQAYPLSRVFAREQVRSHVVVMGNAAHSLHPIAGQGFNLALRDSAALVECVVDARRGDTPIGSLIVLERYLEAQEQDQQLTMGVSHQLIKLFGWQALPVQAGRSLGMLTMEMLRPLKSSFARRAAGIAVRSADLG